MALASPEVTRGAVADQLRGKRLDLRGAIFQGFLLLSLLTALGILVALVSDVIGDSTAILGERPGSFLSETVSLTDFESNGISQGIFGTVGIAVIVILLAFPVGIAAAVYLEEFAPGNRLTRFIDLNIRNLAGVPSIVYGILGLTIFVQGLEGITGGSSLLAGGVTLAVLVLPIVIITSAEAVRAVPDTIREAGFGVGATRWEVTRYHVLPYALPGVITGAMLSLARALGEAAPLILVGAQTGFFTEAQGIGDRLRGDFTALPMQVFNFARQPGDELRVDASAATIVVLLAIVLAINATGILLRNHYEKKRQ